jgi:mRNA interferase RelE/StbE
LTAERYEVVWTVTAGNLLGEIADQRVRQLIFDTTKRLENEPAKQGSPLTRELAGFRDLRAVGQRYRVLYRVEEVHHVVQVVAVGLRREGARDDIYELARRLLRAGLIEPTRIVPRRKKKPGRGTPSPPGRGKG